MKFCAVRIFVELTRRTTFNSSTMKKKVTLSLEERTVALLRKAGARREKPMSAVVDELVEKNEKAESADAPIPDWLREMGTWLEGKVTQKDLEEDSRLAHAYGYKPDPKKPTKRKIKKKTKSRIKA